MISSLRQLFRTREAAPVATVPVGQRIYAVGDVHGRCDLFEPLVEAIELDNGERGPAASTVVLLGDLVDRGPDSYGVLTIAREWQRLRPVKVLLGNHEEMMLLALDNVEVLKQFVRHGGKETLLSFGIDADTYAEATWEQLQQLMHGAVPQRMLDFIRTFEDQVQVGDYLFVHAGIRPGVGLEAQRRADLRWIREPFLSHPGSHGAVVVHGHTISGNPEFRDNRIGIDTGAYDSGVLTALGLEGGERWLITAQATGDGVVTTVTPA